MASIYVDPEELRQAASTIRETEGEIDNVTNYAKEADPDWWIWGLPGLVMAPIYFMAADFFHQNIGNAKEAIDGLATNIEACADAYDDIDTQVGSGFDQIAGAME